MIKLIKSSNGSEKRGKYQTSFKGRDDLEIVNALMATLIKIFQRLNLTDTDLMEAITEMSKKMKEKEDKINGN